MFGFFKNIVRKFVEPAPEEQAAYTVDPETAETPEAFEAPAVPGPPRSYNGASNDLRRGNGPPGNGNGQPRNGNGPQRNGSGIELPLEPILKGLPLEIQPRVRQVDVAGATIYVPLEKILSQLARGVVTISFGELRHAAPDLFDSEPDRDRVPILLPLSDILARLNPALITRKRAQRQVEVPAEVSSPFDSLGRGASPSVGRKVEPTAQEPTFRAKPNPSVAVSSNRGSINLAPSQPPPSIPMHRAPSPTPAPNARRPEPPAGLARKPELPKPQLSAKPAAPPPLMVGLASLAEAWPEAVRQEIVQLNLVDAKVGLPAEAIERALRQGRIAFTWKMLRSWIRPSPLPAVSANDGAVLELPLKVVAPVFLARQNETGKSQQKVAIDEAIPNLFFGFPQPEPAGAIQNGSATPAVTTPVDTNYYVWDDQADTVRADETEVKRPTTPGTSFVTRYATPNEVVSRAAALDGVAGALIALPDGLMVASRIASDLNGETLAAFLPQIFGKISQCTKELRMGDLNNVNFTVGNTPWKIFRVNAIFFAAFGRAGERLPTGQLAALAAELDHKPK